MILTRMLVLITVMLIALTGVAAAADITLTLDSDARVVLHGDRTWSCSNESMREKLERTVITLEDGKEVELRAGRKWVFVTPGSGGSVNENLTTLFHVATAKGSDIQETVKAATDLAVTGLMKRVRPFVDKRVRDADLRACVEDMEKKVEQQEKFSADTYEVRMKLTLDKEAIDGIAECVSLALRLNEQMGSDTARSAR